MACGADMSKKRLECLISERKDTLRMMGTCERTYIKQFEGALTGQIWDNLSVNNANEFITLNRIGSPSPH